MPMVCPGCNLSVDPIRVFDRSPRTGKGYLITKCPRERCGFNIDIEEWSGKRVPPPPPDKKKPGDGDDGRSFWKYGF